MSDQQSEERRERLANSYQTEAAQTVGKGYSRLIRFLRIILPLLALGIIAFDKSVTQLFSTEIYQILFLLSIVPPGANTAAYAAQLDLEPENAATTILIGTLVALISIPLMLALTGLFA